MYKVVKISSTEQLNFTISGTRKIIDMERSRKTKKRTSTNRNRSKMEEIIKLVHRDINLVVKSVFYIFKKTED